MNRPDEGEADRLRVATTALRYARGKSRSLDAITDEASSAYQAEMALVSIVVATAQHFVTLRGLTVQSTHRDVSFCNHALRQSQPLHVLDAMNDVRFMFNPLVLCPPNIRSYLGARVMCEGRPVGALCVMSPRASAFKATSSDKLVRLSAQVGDIIAIEEASDHEPIRIKLG